ncbi:MAG: hypothetical protein JW920_09370 [Deltaproteobacteria bacterium]|nr:hypothetical protein [Deltaproteobacteria bacterium]
MKRAVVVTIVVIVLALLAFFGWSWLTKEPKPEVETQPQTLYQESQDVNTQVPAEKKQVPEAEKSLGVQAPQETTVPELRRPKTFNELQQEIKALCASLDEKKYIQDYKLEGGTCRHMTNLMEKLAYNPPVVTGETRDLYTLLSNTAHLYRTIGQKNIALTKDILVHEQDSVEENMALIDQWLMMGIETGRLKIGLRHLYEYAGFFLDTLGGKAYLSRRYSKTRTLMQYYAILIVDQANKERMNRYGIDIVPFIDILSDDIRSHTGLQRSAEYLAVLDRIKADNKH